ncbi:hypothetical protein BH11BAC3_BH11BAC3_44070 [soil metagenome]
MNKIFKWVLFSIVGGLLLFFIYVFYVFSTFSFDDGKHYSKEDLIDNYKAKTNELLDLKEFINKNVPIGKTVDIEFDGDNRLAIFHVFDNGSNDSNWDLKVNSKKVDTLLDKLNWTQNTLMDLKGKLDAANCISVKCGDPCNIGFQRSGMGKYYYNLFAAPIPDKMIARYNDSCTYIFYSKNVVLEYGGGAIGPQCFPLTKY